MKEANELLDIWEMFYETLEESYLKNPRWQNVRKHRLRFAILFTYKDWCELFWTLKAKIDTYEKRIKELEELTQPRPLTKQEIKKILSDFFKE